MFKAEAISSLVFLILYTFNLAILIYGFSTHRIRFKSVYSFLLLHVLLRLSAQSVGIALGVSDGFDVGLILAYFVLGAEGYFSLVLCAYRFLIHHHQHTYPISGSFLEGKPLKSDDPWYTRLKRSLTARDKSGKKDPWFMTQIHWILIAANTIIIVGGTRTGPKNVDDPDYAKQMSISQAMRVAGQAIFLAINILLLVFLFISKRQDANPNGTLPPRLTKSEIHPTLLILFLAWPPLFIRGVFGVLQSQIDKINYTNVAAYDAGGLSKAFVAVEACLAILPEWLACCLLCCVMFTRDERGRVDEDREEMAETHGLNVVRETGTGNGQDDIHRENGKAGRVI